MFGLVSQNIHWRTFLKTYVDVRWNKISFSWVVSRGSISRSFPQKIWVRLGRTAVPTRKARLVGLLLAWTRQAASALLELSSPTSTSWCGLYRQPDWAPCWLGALRSQPPWDCSWSLQGNEPNSATSSTLGSSKRFFLPSVIGVQQCAGLFLVVLGRLARGRTKPANLLPEGSCKLGSLLAFLSWKQQALSLLLFLSSLCRR